MNKKTIYIVVAVLVVIIVVGVAGVLLLNQGGDGGDATPTPGPTQTPVADATSLQFSVEDETGTYRYSARNIDSETDLAIEYLDETAGFKIVIDGAAHTANSNMTGTWAEEDFETAWGDWNPLFEGYVDSLAHWTEGEYTSEDGTRIFDISVNPTLDDSLFEVPES